MDEKVECKIGCIKANADEASALLRALSNKRRLLIICAISHGECCVGDLEKKIGISQSALSQHLAKLRDEKLVATRRHAQTIYYSISSPAVAELMATLSKIYGSQK